MWGEIATVLRIWLAMQFPMIIQMRAIEGVRERIICSFVDLPLRISSDSHTPKKNYSAFHFAICANIFARLTYLPVNSRVPLNLFDEYENVYPKLALDRVNPISTESINHLLNLDIYRHRAVVEPNFHYTGKAPRVRKSRQLVTDNVIPFTRCSSQRRELFCYQLKWEAK